MRIWEEGGIETWCRPARETSVEFHLDADHGIRKGFPGLVRELRFDHEGDVIPGDEAAHKHVLAHI